MFHLHTYHSVPSPRHRHAVRQKSHRLKATRWFISVEIWAENSFFQSNPQHTRSSIYVTILIFENRLLRILSNKLNVFFSQTFLRQLKAPDSRMKCRQKFLSEFQTARLFLMIWKKHFIMTICHHITVESVTTWLKFHYFGQNIYTLLRLDTIIFTWCFANHFCQFLVLITPPLLSYYTWLA